MGGKGGRIGGKERRRQETGDRRTESMYVQRRKGGQKSE